MIRCDSIFDNQVLIAKEKLTRVLLKIQQEAR
jgi:hypothetical protein